MNFLELIVSLESSILVDIGLVIILATIIAYFAKLLKQPLIPAYIITGLILGPIGFGLIKDQNLIRNISELGIAFLLFVVGLEINLKKLKNVGLVAGFGGIIQIAASYFLAYFVALKLGFSGFESIIVGLVIAFSSTMIVIKLLSDKNEIDTLHGKIILGILIVQDIVIILTLALINTISSFNSSIAIMALAKVLLFFIIAFLCGKFIFPIIFNFAAKSKELLFLSSLTVLFLFSILATFLDFSIAIGAFLAGLTLANLPYHLDIIGKVNPLKNFFATIFFVSLGMQIIPLSLSELGVKILVLFLIIILAKPMILFLITTLFGYEKRTSFLTGLSLAQTSEFSLILISLPFIVGAISKELFSIVIFLTVLTMMLTSYFLEFKNKIYSLFSPFLSLFEKLPIPHKKMEYNSKRLKDKTVVLIGKHRMGSFFYDTITKMRRSIIVIDNNPEVIKRLINQGKSCIYGDLTNTEVLDKLNLKKIKIVISTVSEEDDNLFLLHYIKEKNPKVKVLVTALHAYQAKKLYDKGADYVIVPTLLSGEKVSGLIRKILKRKDYSGKLKEKHSKYLSKLNFE